MTDNFLDLPDPEPLFVAALYHDIGKSGKDHAAKGAVLVRNILRRSGYDPNETEDVCFLVHHHLLLAETATRRDLNDEKIVVQCAGEVGTIERLKMLYLLSWADGKATGPRAWNDWIANLVLELFFKVLHILERGELASPDASKRMRQSMQLVRRQIGGRLSPADKETLFDAAGRVTYFDHLKGIREEHEVRDRVLFDVISGFFYLRTRDPQMTSRACATSWMKFSPPRPQLERYHFFSELLEKDTKQGRLPSRLGLS